MSLEKHKADNFHEKTLILPDCGQFNIALNDE